MTGADGAVHKLCKKYGGPGFEPITNLYLDIDEYARLSGLPGARTMKQRYSLAVGSLDIYQRPSPGLAIFEIEFPNETAAADFVPPAFVGREITGDPLYAGAALAFAAEHNRRDCRAEIIYHLVTASELRAQLSANSYLPVRLAQDGFVHCAGSESMTLAVARDYFTSCAEDVMMLRIATAHLTSRVLFEAPAPIAGGGREHLAGGQLFPHVYGPIDRAAISGVAVLGKAGHFRWPQAFESEIEPILARHGVATPFRAPHLE